MTPRPPRPGGDEDARLSRWLARARPGAPRGRAGEASAVRVLARMAALEGGGREARSAATGRASRAPRRDARDRIAAVTAAILVAGAVGVLGSAFLDGRREPDGAAPWAVARVDAARAEAARAESAPGEAAPGEAAARGAGDGAGADGRARGPEVVPAAGPTPAEVRDRWLTIAEAHASDAADALRELGRLGGPCGAAEAARVAALHRDAGLAAVVRDVLADAPGDDGPKALAAALLAAHAASPVPAAGAVEGAGDVAALVAALERVARRGRATLALDGLRRAADAGCAEAAIGGLRVAGTPELDRALAAVGARPAVRGAFLEALGLRPRVLGAALLRRVERGDRGALALAAAARVEGLARVLRPAVADPTRAGAAVAALAEVGDAPSIETLAVALSGPAAGEARRALEGLAATAVPVLEAAAAGAAMDASADPYVRALAGLGDVALPSLLTLAGHPTLSVRVVRALATSPAVRASEALAALATNSALTRAVVDALGARRAAGDPTAGPALAQASRGAAGEPPSLADGPGVGRAGRGPREPLEPEPPGGGGARGGESGRGDSGGGRDGATPLPSSPGSPSRPAGRGPARPEADGPGVPLPRPAAPPVVPPHADPPTPRAPAPPPAPGGRTKSI